MKSAPVTVYYLEGNVRPCAARWLTDTSLVICRTSGTIEVQPDYNYASTSLYRIGVGICRLRTISPGKGLFVLGDNSFDVISGHTGGLTTTSGVFPGILGAVADCVIAKPGRYVLVSRDGTLWIASDRGSWTSVGRLGIHEITVGCALSENEYAFGSAHGELELITLSPFSTKFRERLHADSVQDILVVDDTTIATVARDRALRVWTVSNALELLWSLPDLHEHFINCAAKAADELWTGSSDGTIAVTSLRSRERIHIFKAHADSVRTVDLSPDGTKLLSLSDGGTYNIYDVTTRSAAKQYGEERQYTRSASLRFQTGQATVAFGTTSGYLHYGEVETGSFSRARISAFSLRALCHLSDTEIICGDETGVLRLFDTGREQVSASVSTGSGLTVIRSKASDQTVLCGYRDGSIKIFKRETITAMNVTTSTPVELGEPSVVNPVLDPYASGVTLKPTVSRRIHESIVGDIFPMRSAVMLSCSDDHTIRMLTSDSLSILKTTSLDGTAINNILVISESIIATTDGGKVFVLDMNTHELRQQYSEHRAPVRALTGITEGVVATGDRLGDVRIWRIDTGDTLAVNRFRERVIELGHDAQTARLLVVTESEVASLQIGEDLLKLTPETPSNPVGARGTRSDKAGNVVIPAQTGKGASVGLPRPMKTTGQRYDTEIARTGRSFQLTPAEDRLIRNFAESRGGTRCEISLLGGGLSDAHVFRLKAYDHSGALRITAVAKIGSREAIDSEAAHYDTEISRLRPEATPRRLATVADGVETISGVFYSLADGYDRSEFQAVHDSPKSGPQIIEHVAALTSPWRERVPEVRTTIGAVRRRLLDDQKLREIAATYSLSWIEEFETRTAQVRSCTIHGDLHGSNILVNQYGSAVIIDYGEIMEGSAAFDPITLEFSHFFHPDGPMRTSEWPTSDACRLWRSDEYVQGSSFVDVIRACWRWAESACAGHRDIAAAAYAYLLTQFQYADTNKRRILDLLIGVRSFYEST